MNTIVVVVASGNCRCSEYLLFYPEKFRNPTFPLHLTTLAGAVCGFLELCAAVWRLLSPIYNKSGQQSQTKKDGTLNLFRASSEMINVTFVLSPLSANKSPITSIPDRGSSEITNPTNKHFIRK